METKEQLVTNIKSWIDIDNKIASLNKQARELKEQTKEITSELVNVMKNNEIDCFDVKDGKLIYSKTKTKAPLNKKNLMACLTPYFQNNSEMAQQLTEHIMNSREEKIKESIRRKKSDK